MCCTVFPTSRGMKGDRGSTSGEEMSYCKMLMARTHTMGLILKATFTICATGVATMFPMV
jgi:hypothetical protein